MTLQEKIELIANYLDLKPDTVKRVIEEYLELAELGD